MSKLFEQIFEFVQRLTEWLGYPGLFVMMFIENFFPPIPTEMMMPFAGSLVAQDKMSFLGALLAGSSGSFMGALVLYAFGRHVGRMRMERWICRYGKFLLVSLRDWNNALSLFARHGNATIFFARLVPGARSLISIPAGISRMPPGSYSVLTILGILTWNSVLLAGGLLLGRNWQRVLDFLDAYDFVFYAASAVFVVYFIVYKLRSRPTAGSSGCEDA